MTTQGEERRGATSLSVFSPAKVNLFLKILHRRPDGFHELETIMTPLDFGDDILLERTPADLLLECDCAGLPVDDRNLALRAARLLKETFNIREGAHLKLSKRIPLAAGLAGGSSNAAAVLLGLTKLWNIQAPPAKLHELAATMGSDINFFLQRGAAICRGRGEKIEPIPQQLSGVILLINPGFGIATRWAYESWAADAARALTAPAPEVSLLARFLAKGDARAVGGSLYNSLEAPSIHKFPVLQLLKEAMLARGAGGALMSGSGATVFGLFESAAAAELAAADVQANFGPSMWTKVCRISQSGEP